MSSGRELKKGAREIKDAGLSLEPEKGPKKGSPPEHQYQNREKFQRVCGWGGKTTKRTGKREANGKGEIKEKRRERGLPLKRKIP